MGPRAYLDLYFFHLRVATSQLTYFFIYGWFQSFGDLVHRPLLVDLTVEEGQRLKVIYGSCSGFHAVDVDSGAVYDIYLPTHVHTHHRVQSSLVFISYCPSYSSFSLLFFSPLRSRRAFSVTPSSSYPTLTASSCWCVTKTRVSTSTPTDASPRTWCCSGEKCQLQWVSFKHSSSFHSKSNT